MLGIDAVPGLGSPYRTRPPGPLASPPQQPRARAFEAVALPRGGLFRLSGGGGGTRSVEAPADHEDSLRARELVERGALRAVHRDQRVRDLADPLLDGHAGQRLARRRALEHQANHGQRTSSCDLSVQRGACRGIGPWTSGPYRGATPADRVAPDAVAKRR